MKFRVPLFTMDGAPSHLFHTSQSFRRVDGATGFGGAGGGESPFVPRSPAKADSNSGNDSNSTNNTNGWVTGDLGGTVSVRVPVRPANGGQVIPEDTADRSEILRTADRREDSAPLPLFAAAPPQPLGVAEASEPEARDQALHDVAALIDEAAQKIERVLTNDPGMGVIRHVDAGYDEARDVARDRGVAVPDRKSVV